MVWILSPSKKENTWVDTTEMQNVFARKDKMVTQIGKLHAHGNIRMLHVGN